ncbi:hypothetical protein COK00_11170 [Bacillus cereus]|uniref:hypothetical protein n=1 Tax=Bacillus cereus TaxID=1396 RepID=UPI000BF4226D|nr:hypothetical protein [Bacillus cereus]PFP65178.1 hypothetical protein COK00_11170 [Bacillus cereus]
MEKPLVVRSMCIQNYKDFKAGQVYTVECYGGIDWGLDYRTFKIEGEKLKPGVYSSCFEQIRILSI